MKNILKIIFLLTSSQLKSQVPNWDWAKNYGGSGYDLAYSISNDASGNSYVFGTFSSDTIIFGTTQLINSALWTGDIFISKYDMNGNALWAKKAGSIADEIAYSGTADAFGNTYVTGFFNGSITFDTLTLFGINYRDVFIAKYDSNGNLLWAKKSGGIGDDEGQSIIVDASGNIYLTGFFTSASIIFGSTTLTNSGNNTSDIFLVKYDANGNVIWAKKAGGNDSDNSTSICIDNYGGVYMTGKFYSSTIAFDSTQLTNSAGYNLFIAKYDSNGNFHWAKNPGLGESKSITSNNQGDIFITGLIALFPVVFGTDTLISQAQYDMFIAKYDTGGNAVWARSAGGAGADWGTTVAVDALNNIYVTGVFLSPYISFPLDTLSTTDTITTYNIFIVSYDNNGNVQWSKEVSGSADETVFSMSISGVDVFLTGFFYGDTITFDTIHLINDTTNNSADLFIAKLILSKLSNYSNDASIANEVNIFPNPVTDKLNIFATKNELSEIIIYDITGRNLLQKEFTYSTTLNMEYFANGIYIYEVRNKSGVVQKGKVWKQ